jgi:TP901 family phage tail tape measure protein
MANTAATFSVGADTRQAERDIKKLVSKNYNINLTTKGEQPLGRITGKVNEFTKSLDASNARVIAFGASAGVIYGLQKAFSTLVSSTIEVQKSLTDINVILNVSTAQLGKFGGELFNIAKNTGQSFQIVAEAATEFSRQGLGVEETLKRTSQALILSRLSGLDAAKSVDALTAAVNSFASEAVSASEVVNKFANVDAAFAVSSGDLAEAISRVGSSAAQSGVSLNELIAIVTSAQQTTARGGAVIGNSFKTIFTRLQRGKVVDLLGSLGISDTGANGQVKSTIQLLQDLAKVYDTLGSRQQSAIAEQVGGVFQINILKSALADLGKEYSVYNAALNTAASSTDQAIRRNEELNKTYAAQINALQQNAKQLGSSVGERTIGPVFNRVVGGANDLLGGVNESDGQGIGATLGKGILDGIGQIIAGPGLILLGGVFFKLVKDFAKFASGSVKELLGLNTATKQQADLQQSINQILSRNPELYALMQKGSAGLNKGAEILLANLRNQTLELGKQQAISAQLASQFLKSGSVSVVGGLPVAKPAKGKAAGNMPPVSDAIAEKYKAISLGATSSVRPHMSQGTIGGQKFVMNDQETEYPRVGKNGDSAVVPHYGDGIQMAARGFIPNFVQNSKRGYSVLDGDSLIIDKDYPDKRLQGKETRLESVDAIESWQKYGDKDKGSPNAKSLAESIIYREFPNLDSALKSTGKTGSAAYDRPYFNSSNLQQQLIEKGLGVPDLRYGSILKGETVQAMNRNIGLWSDKNKDGFYNHAKAQQFIKQNNLEKKLSSQKNLPQYKKNFILGTASNWGNGRYKGGELLPDKYKDKGKPGSKTYKPGKSYNYEAMNASGFIPNFAAANTLKIKDFKKSGRVTADYDKNSSVKGGVNAGLIAPGLYSVGSSGVTKQGKGYGVAAYDAVLETVSSKGAWLTSDRNTVSPAAMRVWDFYRKNRPDVRSEELPMKNWYMDPKFNNGEYQFPQNILDLKKNKDTWPPKTDPVWALQNKYQLKTPPKKVQKTRTFAGGFIPNFAAAGTGSIIDLGDIAAGSPILKGKVASLIHPGDSAGIQKVPVESAYRGQKFKGILPTAGINKGALKQGINIPNVVDDVEQMLLNQANNFGQVLGSSGLPMTPLGKGELPNTGAVKGAAGVAFEGGVKSVVQKSLQAKTQNANIDFSNPSTKLRSIFNKAPGVYDAKYTPALADDVLTKLLRFAQPAVTGVTKPVTSGPGYKDYQAKRQSALDEIKKSGVSGSVNIKRALMEKGFASGFTPNFAARRIGYLDGDVLKDPRYSGIVTPAMKKAKISNPADYHKYLGGLVSQARKSGRLKRFSLLYGMPGSGKSTMMMGGKPGKGGSKLNPRIPILTPEDIRKVDEIIDTRASVPGTIENMQKGGYLSNVDRATILSSSSKESQKELTKRRGLRDQQIKAGEATTNFGRVAGTSLGSPLNSSLVEAASTHYLGKDRTKILDIKPNFKLKPRSKENYPQVEEKKVGLTFGAFAPSTQGHLENMKMAESLGIRREDFIALISRQGGKIDKNDPHSWRTSQFSQNLRAEIAKRTFTGANIAKQSSQTGGMLPKIFDIGDNKFIIPKSGSSAFIGDDKGADSLKRYSDAGYQTVVGKRTEGVSGTDLRNAIFSGDIKTIRKLMTPEASKYVESILPQLQARNEVFPEILNRVDKKVSAGLASVMQDLSKYPPRLTAKYKEENPGVADKVYELRAKRDKIQALMQSLPTKYIKKLGMFPEKYGKFSSGFIPNFSSVQDAVAREQDAGIPKSQIYIAQHQRLAAGHNPLGLGVFNKIDEPTSAARNSAVQKRGSASGFIPNFADEDRQSVGSTVAALGAELSGLALMLSFNKNSYAESLKDLTKANVDKVKADLAAARKSGTFGPQTERETMLANSRIKEAKAGTMGQKATAGLNSGGALAISMLAPIIAETIKNGIDQGTKGGRKAGAVVSGVGQIAGLSATGFMVGGPIGAAVGALAGTVMTFNDYIKEASTNIPELSAAAKKASEKLSSINDSGQVLMQGFQQIQELTGGDTTPEKVQKGAELQSSLLSRVQKDFAGNQEAINTLSVAIQNQDFASLKTALDQNTAAVLKNAQDKQNRLALQTNIEGLRNSGAEATNSTSVRSRQSFANTRVTREKELGYAKGISAEIFKRANGGQGLNVEELKKRIESVKNSAFGFNNIAETAFKDLPGVNDKLLGKLDQGREEGVQAKSLTILEELLQQREQQLATDKDLYLNSIKGNKTIAAYVKILQNVSKLYSEYENSLKNTLSIQNAGNAAIRGAYAGINKSAGERDTGILEAFGNTTAAKSTSSNNGLRQLDLEFNNQISGVIDDLASSIAVAGATINAPKGTDQVGSNGKNVEIAMSRIIDENARLIAATRSPEDIKKSLSSGRGLNLDVLQKTIADLEKMTGANASDETKTLLTQLKEKASKAIEVALQQKAILTEQKTLLANQNFAANVKELMDAVKLTGGGMTGFRKDDLTPLQNVEQSMADFRIALGSPDSKMGSVESGRAASNMTNTLSEFAGRNIGTKLSGDGPAMTAIIEARSKDLLGTLNSMQSDNSKVGGKGKAVADELFTAFRASLIEQSGLGTKTENGKVIQKSSDEMAKISNKDIAQAISTMQVRADANQGKVNKGVMDQSLLNLSPEMQKLFNSQGNAGFTDINQVIAANTNQTNTILGQIKTILLEPRPAPAPDTNAPTSPATTPEGWPVWFSTGAKNRPAGKAKGSIPPGAMAGLFNELSAIKKGVGGASLAKGDRPYLTKVNGETAAVNTGEKIVKNFMGTKKDAVLNRDMLTAAGGIIPHFAAEGSIPDSKYLMGRPRKATKMKKDILSKIPVPVTQILKGVGGNAARFAGPVGLAYSAYGFMDNFGGLPWSDESKKPKEMSPKDMPDYLKEYRTGPRPKFNKFADGFIPNSAENLPIDDYLQELSKTGGISGGSLSAMKTNAPTGFVDIIKNFLGKLGTSSSMARGLIPNLAVGKKSPFEFASLQSAKKPKFASLADGSVPDVAVTSKLRAQIKFLENKLEMELQGSKFDENTQRRSIPNPGPILDQLSKLKAKYNSYKDNWELLGGRDKNVAGKQLNTKTGEFGDVPKAIDMRPIRADDMMARREYQMDKAGEQMDNISNARSAKEYISARIRGENDGKGGFMYAGDEAGYQEYVRGSLTKYSDMKDSEQFQALAKEAGITNMAEGRAIRAEYANNGGKATRVVDDQMSANGMSVITRDQVNADNARSQHGGPLKASMSSQAQQLNSRYMMPNMALGNNSSKNFSVNLKNDIKMDGGGGGGDVESKLTELGDQIKQLVSDNIQSIAARVGLVENQMAGFGQAAEYVKNMSSKNPEYNAPPRIRN